MTGDSAARRRVVGIVVTLVGVAHFAVPRLFDPVNRLGFPDRTRLFTYVNGGVETVIGLLSLDLRTRRLRTVVAVCYVAHLIAAIVRTRRRSAARSAKPAASN